MYAWSIQFTLIRIALLAWLHEYYQSAVWRHGCRLSEKENLNAYIWVTVWGGADEDTVVIETSEWNVTGESQNKEVFIYNFMQFWFCWARRVRLFRCQTLTRSHKTLQHVSHMWLPLRSLKNKMCVCVCVLEKFIAGLLLCRDERHATLC